MTCARHGLHLLVAAVLAGVLAGCGRAPETPAESPARPLTRIGLERTACFGFCPEYQLVAAADGAISFRGMHRWQGFERRWRIPPDSVAALGAELTRVGFFGLGDIVPNTPACGLAATDHPSIVLTAGDGGREHRVALYTGCMGSDSVAGRLKRLAGRIDSVTGAAAIVDSLQRARAAR